MSAIAPRNSSPAIVVEKKDAFNPQLRNAMNSFNPYGNQQMMTVTSSSKDVIIEIIVLAAAAVGIIIVAYIVFKPLFTGIFQTALDTINTLTDITAETLGTVTEVLGGVIDDASGVIKTVTNTVADTIDILSDTITGTLDSIAGPVSSTNPEGGSLTKISNTIISTVNEITDIIVSQENVGTEEDPKPKGIIPRLVQTVDGIINTTEKLLTGEGGIMETITGFINDFKGIIETASNEFQAILKSLKAGADTVINGITDGIRYLVDPFVNETYGIPAIGNKMLATIEVLTGGVEKVGDGIKEAIESISTAINGLI
jgi:phage-related protein